MRRSLVLMSGMAVLAGCAGQTAGERQALALTSTQTVAGRQLSQRRYQTTDEALLLQAGAGVLQDLGFTIDETSPGSGMLVASKQRDATEAGQVAGQMLLVMLAAAAKTHYDPVYEREQRIRVSLTIRPTPDHTGLLARATFQRVIWNNRNQVSRLETIDDPQIYKEFFERLNQSTFLQAQDI